MQENIKLPDNPALPNVGMLDSTNKVVLSNGQGAHGGMGSGAGGGLGSGSGNGMGPGSGGNMGGGVYQVGNGISAPTVTYSVEAEFSDEARETAQQHGQNAGGERVERAEMADGTFAGETAEAMDGVMGGDAGGFVEDEQAVHFTTVTLFGDDSRRGPE